MAGRTTKLTVDPGDQLLYRELRLAAAEQARPLREIVIEALRAWLEANEDSAHLAEVRRRRQEPTITLKELKRRLPALDD